MFWRSPVSLLNPGGVALEDEEALAGGHVPPAGRDDLVWANLGHNGARFGAYYCTAEMCCAV